MFKNISPKAIALGGISAAVLGMVGIAVETTKAELFEIRNSIAAIQAARATAKAADASYLDAINKLKGTIETAAAMNNVGQLQANATIAAANRVAAATITAAETTKDGLITATTINMHPENEMYDNVTGPLFGQPIKKIAALNERINYLKWQAQRSPDANQQTAYMAQLAVLEEEKATVNQTGAQNFSDMISMVLGGVGQTLGGMAQLYPNAQTPRPAPRMILLER